MSYNESGLVVLTYNERDVYSYDNVLRGLGFFIKDTCVVIDKYVINDICMTYIKCEWIFIMDGVCIIN